MTLLSNHSCKLSFVLYSLIQFYLILPLHIQLDFASCFRPDEQGLQMLNPNKLHLLEDIDIIRDVMEGTIDFGEYTQWRKQKKHLPKLDTIDHQYWIDDGNKWAIGGLVRTTANDQESGLPCVPIVLLPLFMCDQENYEFFLVPMTIR